MVVTLKASATCNYIKQCYKVFRLLKLPFFFSLSFLHSESDAGSSQNVFVSCPYCLNLEVLAVMFAFLRNVFPENKGAFFPCYKLSKTENLRA